jgi:hypothetical protein
MTVQIADLDAFVGTRDALHAVAEHVLAAYRYHAERRIGLAATSDGFGTPELPDGSSARVAATDLVVTRDGRNDTSPLTTLTAAAAACGIEPGAPGVYAPVTPLVPDAPILVEAGPARELADWIAFGWARLAELGATPTIWPEHFDAAVELGDEADDSKGTFGASPGDAEHREPYLYVTHWSPKPDDPYWNDDAFAGASVQLSALTASGDPEAAARAFFDRGRELVGSS